MGFVESEGLLSLEVFALCSLETLSQQQEPLQAHSLESGFPCFSSSEYDDSCSFLAA